MNNTDKNNNDIYVPEKKNKKSSPLIEFIKFTLVVGLVVFVSFFIYCSVQLGKIGN